MYLKLEKKELSKGQLKNLDLIKYLRKFLKLLNYNGFTQLKIKYKIK